MRIGYTPEQEELRRELRVVLRQADDPRAGRGAGRQRRRDGPRQRLPRDRRPDGQGRLADTVVAQGVRRPGPPADGRADLQRRGRDRQRAGAVPDHQQRRADDHALRHRGAEEVLPAQDRRRRTALLHRLLRARRGHRPRVAAHHRGARRRRLRHQRPEDVDQPDRLRRLRLAGRAHQPRSQEAPRHLDADRADHRRGLLLDAGAHHGRRRHQRHLLPGRPGADDQPGRRGERRLEAGHQPAQPRAGGAGVGAADLSALDERSRVGAEHQGRPRQAADRLRVGAAQPRPGARQGRVPQADQLGARLRRDGRRAVPGRRVGGQGVRHRVGHRGLPTADGGARHRRRRCAPTPPARCCAAASSACTGPA